MIGVVLCMKKVFVLEHELSQLALQVIRKNIQSSV